MVALDTGDRIDATIGDRTFKTRSAADLPGLGFIVRLATSARFVRVVKGNLVATNAGRSIGRKPLADLARLVAAIDDVGVVSARTAGGRYIWTSLAPFFDDLFVPIAMLLFSAPRGVKFDEIVERAFEEFEDEIDGIELPVARRAEFTDLDFDKLIEACERIDSDDFGRLRREIDAWVEHRGDQAVIDLVDAARTTDDHAVRNIALAVVGDQFGAAAEPDVRGLLDSPITRGSALLWLVDHDHEPTDVLIDPDPAVFVDVLALTLAIRGPADMLDVFEHTGNHETQLAVLKQLAQQANPAAGAVLETLAVQHPR